MVSSAPTVQALGPNLGFRLSCSAIGISPINIVIIWNSKTLVNETNTASIQVDKEGKYICRATSKYGADERQFVVISGEDTQIIPFELFPSTGKRQQLFITNCMYFTYHLVELE